MLMRVAPCRWLRNSEHHILLRGAATTPRRARPSGREDGEGEGEGGPSGVSRRAMRARGNRAATPARRTRTAPGNRGCRDTGLPLSLPVTITCSRFLASSPHPWLPPRGSVARQGRRGRALRTTGGWVGRRGYHLSRTTTTTTTVHYKHTAAAATTTRARVFTWRRATHVADSCYPTDAGRAVRASGSLATTTPLTSAPGPAPFTPADAPLPHCARALFDAFPSHASERRHLYFE